MNFSRIRRLTAVLAVAVAAAAPAAAHADTLHSIGIGSRSTLWSGVLDVVGGSTAAGTKVIQYSVTGGANQRWDVIGSHIINTKSQLCLTTPGSAGGQLYVTYCNSANSRQDWEFNVPQYVLLGQTGDIYNRATGLCVDVQGGSGLAGTPIIGWTATGGENQYFRYVLWN